MNAGRIMRIIGAVFCIALVSGLGVRSVSASLIGQWNFESLTNPSGSTPDSSGNGNDLNAYGPDPLSLSTDTRPGSAGASSLSFPGAGGTYTYHLNLNNSDLSINNQFTMSAWIKPVNPNDAGIMSLADTYAGPYFALSQRTDINGFVRLHGLVYDGATWHEAYTSATIPNGVWSQVAAQYFDGVFSMYLNGASVYSAPISLITPFTTSITEFNVGLAPFYNNWTGLIDDASLSNTAIPEPSTMLLFGMGGLTMVWFRRRKQ